MLRILGFSVLLLMIGSVSFAAEPVIVKDAFGEQSLGLHLEFLEDTDGTLSVEDIHTPEVMGRFTPVHDETPNYGFTQSVYWFSFSLQNPETRSLQQFLEIGYPHLDDIDIYLFPQVSEQTHYHLGDKLAFSKRLIEHRNFVVPITLQGSEILSVLVRVRTSSSMRVPIRLSSEQSFFQRDATEVIIHGFYFGLILVMALYNLFVYISLRETVYLYYVFFVVGCAGFQAALSGFSYQYLWPTMPWWAEKYVIFSIAMGQVFAALFANTFLDLRQYARRHFRYLSLIALLSAAVAGLAFLVPYALVVPAVTILVVLLTPACLSAGVVRWRQGNTEAAYYTLGWASFALGTCSLALGNLGVLPVNVLTINGPQIGTAFVVIFLSLALVRKLKVLHEESETLSKKLVVALDQAQSADRLKGEILANLSHELRTPLNALINVPSAVLSSLTVVCAWFCAACDLSFQTDDEEEVDGTQELTCPECEGKLVPHKSLQTSVDPEDLLALLSRMSQSSTHLAKTLSGILEFAKLQSGTAALMQRIVVAGAILEEVADEFTSPAIAKGIRIEIHLPDNPASIDVDRDQVALLLRKLIENAVEFSKRNADLYLRIAYVRNGQAIRISVRDEGPGIAEADFETIFESFRQVDSGHTRSHPGVGLGLSIARQIATTHGTQIEVESEPGCGSTFSVEFPLDSGKGVGCTN
ncbi:MAG: sensor histidine kinase [Deltaproteobacteria bacterium]|jgi:two-component system, sensor histidine kinase LadS|nr:sensor histidine kinase [Deltaproteobacteria bacterium]MBT6431977.1 sensor histidine kinase [Deltaproteobacteria bacterium]MBT6491780.1 sensor histidine kinase [Deltaproteobacteria bacterium]